MCYSFAPNFIKVIHLSSLKMQHQLLFSRLLEEECQLGVFLIPLGSSRLKGLAVCDSGKNSVYLDFTSMF